MSENRFTLRAAVYLILLKDNEVLLLRRFNTGWQDGSYSLVAGHLDGNEAIIDAMIREAKEEADIALDPDNLRVVHTMHRLSKSNFEYVDFFLVANSWTGELKNLEPSKCDELKWSPITRLPENTLPHVRQALDCYAKQIAFSEFCS